MADQNPNKNHLNPMENPPESGVVPPTNPEQRNINKKTADTENAYFNNEGQVSKEVTVKTRRVIEKPYEKHEGGVFPLHPKDDYPTTGTIKEEIDLPTTIRETTNVSEEKTDMKNGSSPDINQLKQTPSISPGASPRDFPPPSETYAKTVDTSSSQASVEAPGVTKNIISGIADESVTAHSEKENIPHSTEQFIQGKAGIASASQPKKENPDERMASNKKAEGKKTPEKKRLEGDALSTTPTSNLTEGETTASLPEEETPKALKAGTTTEGEPIQVPAQRTKPKEKTMEAGL